MMPTLWPSYILILLAALLGLLIPILLPQIWRIGRSGKAKNESNTPQRVEVSELSAPVAIRFHLAALLFIGFLGLTLLMIPLLFSVHSESGNLSVLTLIGIALPTLIVLFYALRKGDLSWFAPKSKDEDTP